MRVERNWVVIGGTISSLNFKCCLVNIYNPCCTGERASVWASLTDYWTKSKIPMLFLGDFDEVLDPKERGSNMISQAGVFDFRSFIQDNHLTEIPASNGWFTWFRGAAKSKLDRLLVNPEWISKFPSLQVTIQKRSLSDHYPLLIKSDNFNWGPKPFQFKNCWLSHPGCIKIIKDVLAGQRFELVWLKIEGSEKKIKSMEFGRIRDH